MIRKYQFDRAQFESLMKRLRIPTEQWPETMDGTGLWLLHRWRERGTCCCIVIDSDYELVWYVYWRYDHKYDRRHLRHSLRASFADFDEAIWLSAAAACGINVDVEVRSARVRSKFEHMEASVSGVTNEAVNRHFADIEHQYDSR